MSEQRAQFDAWQASFSKAVERVGYDVKLLSVDGCQVRLETAGRNMQAVVSPSVSHLPATTTNGASPVVTLSVWDAAESDVYPPPPSFSVEDYRRYGQRAIWDDGRFAFMHAPIAGMLFAYDRSRRRGYFWVVDACEMSIYDRAAPLQTLLHWALNEFGWHIIHAAAIGYASGGLLLIGNSGAGKSSTALSAIQCDGLRHLSDDKCLVRLEPEPCAFSIFNSAKLKADMLDELPELGRLAVGWDRDAKPGKFLAYLHPTYSERMISSFPLRAIVIPRIAHLEEPVLIRASAREAFRVLGPSTIIWLPGSEASSYRFMARLVQSLPCYFLELATRPQDNLPALDRLITQLNDPG